MTALSRETQLALVAEASRAPSAHNTQPARWRFEGEHLTLFEEVARRLPVADPENRDGRISLGAAYEGMHLALSRRGYQLGNERRRTDAPEEDSAEEDQGRRVIATATVAPTQRDPDPLTAWVDSRQTWRGRFRPATDEESERLRVQLAVTDDVVAIRDDAAVAALAKLHDRCIWSFLQHADYHAELYDWLRFSPRDPNWKRDGLTTDCMALTAAERAFMRWVFHPLCFNGLKRIGLGPTLASEAAAVRSATAVALLHAPLSLEPFDGGRRLYRFWLELTALGFSACPMSATVDSQIGRDELRRRGLLPESRQPINMLRIGPVRTEIPESRRLPAEELLVWASRSRLPYPP